MKELIKMYPELGEVLADFENRLSYLANSQPYQKEPPKEPEPEEPWVSKQWDVVNQLRAKVNYLQGKVNAKYDKKQDGF